MADEFNDDSLRRAASGRDRARRKTLETRSATQALSGRLHNQQLPQFAITWRDPTSLHPPERNVKEVSEAQVGRVAASIDKLRYVQPILCTGEDVIIDGVATCLAAINLGLREVPVIAVDHLDDQGVELLRLALNRLPSRADWNADNLRIAITTLVEAEVDLDFVFEAPEIDVILEDDATSKRKDDKLEDVSTYDGLGIFPGQVWALGCHRLVQGDARDGQLIDTLVGGAALRLVLTDPPYNVGSDIVPGLKRERNGAFVMGSGELGDEAFKRFLAEAFDASQRRLVDGGLLYSFMDWRHIGDAIQAGESLGLDLLNIAAWVKTQPGLGSLYRSQHELCAIFKKGEAGHVNNIARNKYGRDRSNVWRYPGANVKGSSAGKALIDHPTPKCVEMIKDIILDVTNRGDTILDPFMGSGTTLIAAHRTGRVSCGIELDPRYMEAIIRRWEAVTGIPARLADTGATLDEVRETGPAPAAAELLCLPAPKPRIRVQASSASKGENP